MPRIFTDEQKALIRKYYKSGLTPMNISKKVNISYSSTCTYIKLHINGIPVIKRTKKPISKKLTEIIAKEIKTNTVKNIIEKYHVTESTVCHIKEKRKIKNINSQSLIQLLIRNDQVKTDFANKLPFYLIYTNYCQNHGNISYNTFYQTCRRIGYFKKVGLKRKGSPYYIKKLHQTKLKNSPPTETDS
jgi:hypothetical protein